jgi:hypothetical protein
MRFIRFSPMRRSTGCGVIDPRALSFSMGGAAI